MARQKARAFQIELAVCLLAPLVVLAAIAFPGYGHVRKLKQDVARHEESLDEIPLLECRLSDAVKSLAPYRAHNDGKDKSGEISLQVSKTLSDQGVRVKSVTADKVVSTPASACMEYRISVAGEGALGALIRALDELDRPVQCLKVASLRIRAKVFIPETVYDVDTVFVSDFLNASDQVGAPQGGPLEARLRRLQEGVKTIEAKKKERKPILDTRKIDRRKLAVKQVVAPILQDEPVGFRLNGIIRDGRVPLALTDRGVFGVGDMIDGYRIIQVADDHIVVAGRTGRQELVLLYKSEVKP